MNFQWLKSYCCMLLLLLSTIIPLGCSILETYILGVIIARKRSLQLQVASFQANVECLMSHYAALFDVWEKSRHLTVDWNAENCKWQSTSWWWWEVCTLNWLGLCSTCSYKWSSSISGWTFCTELIKTIQYSTVQR